MMRNKKFEREPFPVDNTNNKTDIEELFFDDNCTFDNSLKQISKNRFYIKIPSYARNLSD